MSQGLNLSLQNLIDKTRICIVCKDCPSSVNYDFLGGNNGDRCLGVSSCQAPLRPWWYTDCAGLSVAQEACAQLVKQYDKYDTIMALKYSVM